MLLNLLPKEVPNTENAIETAIAGEIVLQDRGMGKGLPHVALIPQMMQLVKEHHPGYPEDREKDFPACLEIAKKIAERKGWPEESITNGHQQDVEKAFVKMIKFVLKDKWFKTKRLEFWANNFQDIVLSINSKKEENVGKNNSGGSNGIKPARIGLTGPEDTKL